MKKSETHCVVEIKVMEAATSKDQNTEECSIYQLSIVLSMFQVDRKNATFTLVTLSCTFSFTYTVPPREA